jgi:hypothetical protein
MQDNEPLMRALSALIVTNEPDLVLFVGEALVGNDAVDQLSKFKVGSAAAMHCKLHMHSEMLSECEVAEPSQTLLAASAERHQWLALFAANVDIHAGVWSHAML